MSQGSWFSAIFNLSYFLLEWKGNSKSAATITLHAVDSCSVGYMRGTTDILAVSGYLLMLFGAKKQALVFSLETKVLDWYSKLANADESIQQVCV